MTALLFFEHGRSHCQEMLCSIGHHWNAIAMGTHVQWVDDHPLDHGDAKWNSELSGYGRS